MLFEAACYRLQDFDLAVNAALELPTKYHAAVAKSPGAARTGISDVVEFG
jgi:hypothetical protein